MGRWTQYDEDDYRLDGLKRVAYDADTQTYTYEDPRNGQRYKGVPGSQYGVAAPMKQRDPEIERPEAFAGSTGGKSPTSHKLSIDATPATFQEFLPSSAITSPTKMDASESAVSPGRSRFMDAARRATMPKLGGVVDGLRRSATTARKSVAKDDEKRGLLRNASVASSTSSFSYFDEKKEKDGGDEKEKEKGLGRSATTRNPPKKFSLRRVEEDAPAKQGGDDTPRKFSLRRVDEDAPKDKDKAKLKEKEKAPEMKSLGRSATMASSTSRTASSSSRKDPHAKEASSPAKKTVVERALPDAPTSSPVSVSEDKKRHAHGHGHSSSSSRDQDRKPRASSSLRRSATSATPKDKKPVLA